MARSQFDYSRLVASPKALGFFLGWLSQKVVWLTHQAFAADDVGCWEQATREVYRICDLCCKSFSEAILPSNVRELMTAILNWYGENGYWVSPEGQSIRLNLKEDAAGDYPHAGDGVVVAGGSPFFPRFPDCPGAPGKSFAATVDALKKLLDAAFNMHGNAGAGKLGVAAAGHCFCVWTVCAESTAALVTRDMAQLGLLPLPASEPVVGGRNRGPRPPSLPGPEHVSPLAGRQNTPYGLSLREADWLRFRESNANTLASVFRHAGLHRHPWTATFFARLA